MAASLPPLDLQPHNLAGQTFYLPASIEPSNIIGKGSYGVVISAKDQVRGGRVAIKKIKPYAGDEWEARHTLREIQLMRLLDIHPNVVSLRDLWARDDAGELYLTMELMDSDLHQIIQSKQKLSEPHHQCLMKQLLLGVQAMHMCGILHRDLKPGNLLVTRDCQLRITDFGLARAWSTGASPEQNNVQVGVMTEYVVTRWYRCPELLLAPHLPYHGAIDLWSVGCIFAELVSRRPLFPGKSYVHQVQVILDVLGTPSKDEFGFEPRDDAAAFLKRQKHRQGVTWERILPQASTKARDFLAKLLTWDPNTRLSVDEALGHAWLEDAPPLPVPAVSRADMLRHKAQQGISLDFEDTAMPLASLRKQIVEEVALYHGRRQCSAQPHDIHAATAQAAGGSSTSSQTTTAARNATDASASSSRPPTHSHHNQSSSSTSGAQHAAGEGQSAPLQRQSSTSVAASKGRIVDVNHGAPRQSRMPSREGTPSTAASTASVSTLSSNAVHHDSSVPRSSVRSEHTASSSSLHKQDRSRGGVDSAGSGMRRSASVDRANPVLQRSPSTGPYGYQPKRHHDKGSSTDAMGMGSLRDEINRVQQERASKGRSGLPAIRQGLPFRTSSGKQHPPMASNSARGRLTDRLNDAMRFGQMMNASSARGLNEDRKALVRANPRDLRVSRTHH